MTASPDFAEMAWLFDTSNRNRGIIRQNIDEAALLWKAVRSTRGPVLEIGRRHGGSTVLLIQAASGRMVTSIDLSPVHHPACENFFSAVDSERPGNLRLIVGDSRVPRVGDRFGFMFVDGDHTYDGVRADVSAHWRSLRPFDGVPAGIVFHDAVPNDGLAYAGRSNHHDGVTQVCDELVALGCAVPVARAGSSLWLRKTAELPWSYLAGTSEQHTVIDTSGIAALSHLKRREDIAHLLPEGATGIELGIAEGTLSERLLSHPSIGFLYGVDMYAGDRGHDVEQYMRALSRMEKFRGRYSLLHLRFDQALHLFPDETFDFVYVDGYAHTGEEDGTTFRDWWPKLKPGGLFAGDDYDAAWPHVVRHVDSFLRDRGLTGYVITSREKDTPYCKYPTWFTFKPAVRD